MNSLNFKRRTSTMLERNDGQVLIIGRPGAQDRGRSGRLYGPYNVWSKDRSKHRVAATMKEAIEIGRQF